MLRVLIADDSPVVRKALEARLSAVGARVTLAASAKEATAADPRELDVALLDVDLGDGSGIEVARQLRAISPALRVAFFSGEADPEGRAHSAGPVFAKPSGLDAAVEWVTRTPS